MKKSVIISVSIILAAIMAFSVIYAYAAAYSSEDDPLVTLSYINKVLLPEIRGMISDAVAGADIGDVTMETPEETTEETTEATTEATEAVTEETFPLGTVNTGARYTTVNLKEGETLYASVYSCEVIVRSGKTAAVSPFTVKYEEQGISDTTAGKDIYNGEAVPNNHTIIIPRDDGRGITTLEGGAWVMVRGDYIIKSPKAAETAEATKAAEETAEATEASTKSE